MQVLFVLGVARSGTSFVNQLLDDWFDYGMGPEGSFIPEFARRLPHYEPLTETGNLHRLLVDVCSHETLSIAREAYPVGHRINVTPEILLALMSRPTYAEVIRAVFEALARAQGRRHLGNKYPSYWRHLDLLEELFPESAGYLAVVRDGRDVAMSTLAMPWGERSVYKCATHWLRAQSTMDRFAERIGPVRFKSVRYEDLLGQPESTLADIETFLDARLDEKRRRGATTVVHEAAGRFPTEKWRTAMTSDQRRVYEAVAGPMLEKLGYELSVDGASVCVHERVFFEVQDIVRRARGRLTGPA